MEAAGGAAVPPAYRSASREREPAGGGGRKVGERSERGEGGRPARFTAGGERPYGVGAAGSRGGGLVAGGRRARRGEARRGSASPTKGSGQGREPRGAEGRRRAGLGPACRGEREPAPNGPLGAVRCGVRVRFVSFRQM